MQTVDGRYIVQLPFKSGALNCGNPGDSRREALSRKLEYGNVLHEYIQSGLMELSTHQNNDIQTDYYLPHHAVIKEQCTTTKLRVVLNASVSSPSDVSLTISYYRDLHCNEIFLF